MPENELTDQFQIRDLKHRYTWAIDEVNEERFLDCFADDATYLGKHYDDEEPFVKLQGIEEIASFIENRRKDARSYDTDESQRKTIKLRQHRASSPVIDIEGSEAKGHWYFTGLTKFQDGTSEIMIGEYSDEYRRIEGKWKYTKLLGEILVMSTIE